MKKTKLYDHAAITLVAFIVYCLAVMWIYDGQPESKDARIGTVVIGFFYLAFANLITALIKDGL